MMCVGSSVGIGGEKGNTNRNELEYLGWGDMQSGQFVVIYLSFLSIGLAIAIYINY